MDLQSVKLDENLNISESILNKQFYHQISSSRPSKLNNLLAIRLVQHQLDVECKGYFETLLIDFLKKKLKTEHASIVGNNLCETVGDDVRSHVTSYSCYSSSCVCWKSYNVKNRCAEKMEPLENKPVSVSYVVLSMFLFKLFIS